MPCGFVNPSIHLTCGALIGDRTRITGLKVQRSNQLNYEDNLVARVGIEPTANTLSRCCSTTELPGNGASQRTRTADLMIDNHPL